jgi:GntR family transcriptional regulator, transcriptional repressor for pyruvate dehydrogenase complex
LKKVATVSAARRAAEIMREETYRLQPGDFLGSEDELVAKLGISAPTFRQAARLLEHEHLLEIRRGAKGGYFVARPSARSVVQSSAIYLQAAHASVPDGLEVSAALSSIMVRTALKCRKATFRDAVRANIDAPWSVDDPAGEARRATEFIQLLADTSPNIMFRLFIDILYNYALRSGTVSVLHHDSGARIPLHNAHRRALGEAILAGDEALAQTLNRESWRMTEAWHMADSQGDRLHLTLRDIGKPSDPSAPLLDAGGLGARAEEV